MQGLSVQTSVLISALMVSISILMHGGIIKVGTNNAAAPAALPAAGQPAAQAAKTPDQTLAKLKEYAGKVGVDQGKFDKCLDSGEKTSAVTADQTEGTALGVQGTPSFFINGRPLMIGAAPFEEFKKVIDEELNGTAPVGTERKTVGIGNLSILGSANAPVTFVEFSDYECPFCSRFYLQAEKQIKKDYIDTGKVKFYYRDYPLTQIHPGAQKAAEAARCAGDQNKFWEFHNAIFENQTDIF